MPDRPALTAAELVDIGARAAMDGATDRRGRWDDASEAERDLFRGDFRRGLAAVAKAAGERTGLKASAAALEFQVAERREYERLSSMASERGVAATAAMGSTAALLRALAEAADE